MQRHLVAFLRPMLRVLFPALVFFLTGAAAVYRQGAGFEIERKMLAAEEEFVVLEAMRDNLQQEIVFLSSRGRIAGTAQEKLSLRQPGGPQIVILQVQSSASSGGPQSSPPSTAP